MIKEEAWKEKKEEIKREALRGMRKAEKEYQKLSEEVVVKFLELVDSVADAGFVAGTKSVHPVSSKRPLNKCGCGHGVMCTKALKEALIESKAERVRLLGEIKKEMEKLSTHKFNYGSRKYYSVKDVVVLLEGEKE